MSEVAAAARRARGPQPLWAVVPPMARGRYLRRAAQALLDEVDDLAGRLAEDAGMPRTEVLLGELLPGVAGLRALADDGPAALADRRLGRTVTFRRAWAVQVPLGVVGVRSGPATPWAEPLLEVAASVLAGNGVVLSAVEAPRLAATLERAGVPEGLVQPVPAGAALEPLADACDRVVDTGHEHAKATMLLLEGAPLGRAVDGALWGAFARSGRGPAAVGRVVGVRAAAAELAARVAARAADLTVGDARDPGTEIASLASESDAARVAELVAEAVEAGAELLCGGRTGARSFAPAVLRGVPPGARVLTEPVPGPVLAVSEAPDEAAAIELVRGTTRVVSVWAADPAHGRRVARALGAHRAWVNDHGVVSPAAPARLHKHVTTLQLGSSPSVLRSARRLPYDPVLVRASTAAARLLHGRESERPAALRAGAVPLARAAARVALDAARRR